MMSKGTGTCREAQLTDKLSAKSLRNDFYFLHLNGAEQNETPSSVWAGWEWFRIYCIDTICVHCLKEPPNRTTETSYNTQRIYYEQMNQVRIGILKTDLWLHLSSLLGIHSQDVLVVADGVLAVLVLSTDVPPQGLQDAMGLKETAGPHVQYSHNSLFLSFNTSLVTAIIQWT